MYFKRHTFYFSFCIYSVCHVPLAVPTLWYTLYTQLLYTKIMYSFLEFENKYDLILFDLKKTGLLDPGPLGPLTPRGYPHIKS